MNKKILAIIMALLMVAMSTVAMADDAAFSKVYTVKGGTSPEVTFTFDVGAGTVVEGSTSTTETVNAPAVDGNISVGPVTYTAEDFADGVTTKEIPVVINKAAFTEVGIYTYPLSETNSKVAGVNYDTTNMILYVFRLGDGSVKYAIKVVNSADKAEGGKGLTFTNDYEAGSLAITKQVSGAYADPNKDFDITVTLNPAQGEDYSKASITATGADYNATVKVGDPFTFSIHSGETVTLSNIPHGVTYTVSEADYSGLGYTSDIQYSDTADVKTIASTEADTVTVTNTKGDEQIDTGVFTDNMPYFMLLAFVMMLAAAMLLKKRTVNE